jgi:ubiquinone/menaquinone biosynthesis C-methylase UbiE
VGCGDGTLSVVIGEIVKAKEIYGIDISLEAVSLAKKRGIRSFQIDTDKEDFPFEENFFDFVFCSEIIEHVFDTDKLLCNIYRVMKPGAKMLITTPNLAAWYSRIGLLLGYNPMRCSVSLKNPQSGKMFKIKSYGFEHIRFFTLVGLKDLLKYNGFTIEKIFGFYEVPSNVNVFFKQMIKLCDKFFSQIYSFASDIGVFCKK